MSKVIVMNGSSHPKLEEGKIKYEKSLSMPWLPVIHFTSKFRSGCMFLSIVQVRVLSILHCDAFQIEKGINQANDAHSRLRLLCNLKHRAPLLWCKRLSSCAERCICNYELRLMRHWNLSTYEDNLLVSLLVCMRVFKTSCYRFKFKVSPVYLLFILYFFPSIALTLLWFGQDRIG